MICLLWDLPVGSGRDRGVETAAAASIEYRLVKSSHFLLSRSSAVGTLCSSVKADIFLRYFRPVQLKGGSVKKLN